MGVRHRRQGGSDLEVRGSRRRARAARRARRALDHEQGAGLETPIRTPISIRHARRPDLPALVAIDPLGRTEYLARAIRESKCWIARAERAAGFVVFDQTFFGYGFIWLLVVAPEYRRRGIATSLIHYIESICPTAKLFTSANQSNTIMQALCGRTGFVPSGVIDNLDDDDPEVVYYKRLREEKT
ncbi:MAG: GNAT family N-acetyltransferase [Actinobacteria bacterium]|nr:GNAT family N-acetyltransferase [Actinomycetota bacterium]